MCRETNAHRCVSKYLRVFYDPLVSWDLYYVYVSHKETDSSTSISSDLLLATDVSDGRDF